MLAEHAPFLLFAIVDKCYVRRIGRQPGEVHGGGSTPLLAHSTFGEKIARSVNFFNKGARVRFSPEKLTAKIGIFRYRHTGRSGDLYIFNWRGL